MSSITTIEETPTLKRESIVFTSGGVITINAPADKVFAAILDTSKYGEWNSWCPKLVFPEGEEIKIGSQGVLHCRMEAQKKDYEIPVTILELSSNPDRRVFAWRGGFLPAWAAVAERVQTVTPSADGKSCEVRSWESMTGWAAYPLKYFMGLQKQLDESNVTYVKDLKRHCEG